MGVPAFFRWLSNRYSKIVKTAIEEKELNGDKNEVDLTFSNPNGVEYDNLYLDMNGIIHPCCHPEDRPQPTTEDEMILLVFEYIDRIFNIVRPRNLLYMAIDGVAPRAKMNQQRSRRFRHGQELEEKIKKINEIRDEMIQRGQEPPPMPSSKEFFDNNCITPGTEFMIHLAKCLRYYVINRLNTNPAWKNIKVLLSDAQVPGEGEHKIMDFIRKQRENVEYNPNMKHLLYGADADLIMLGLASHEVYFHVLREDFPVPKYPPCVICNQMGHQAQFCPGELPKEKEIVLPDLMTPTKFIFIQLNVLREYLQKELLFDLPFPYDFERVLDDWIFICFFVGNDFLPHLPSLDIREGAIDTLVTIYKENIARLSGYITENGFVDCLRTQKLLKDIGLMEDKIFQKRKDEEDRLIQKNMWKDKKISVKQT